MHNSAALPERIELRELPVPSSKCVCIIQFTYFSQGYSPSDDLESRKTIEIGHSNRQTYHIDPGSAPDEGYKKVRYRHSTVRVCVLCCLTER